MQVDPPCSDKHFEWDRVNKIFWVSFFPGVGYNVHLHKGIGASRAFPAATLSPDFSFTMCNLVYVGFELQNIRNGALFGQQEQKDHLIQEITSSIPNPARRVIIWIEGHWGVFVVEFSTRLFEVVSSVAHI